MSRSERGWCRFFSSCDVVSTYDNAAAWVTYSRQPTRQNNQEWPAAAAQEEGGLGRLILAGASCVGGEQRASTTGLAHTTNLEYGSWHFCDL